MKELKRAFVNIALTFSILFVLYLTMIPHELIGTGNVGGGSIHRFNYNLNPLLLFDDYQEASLKYLIVNDLGNILLFIPFGFILSVKYPQFKLAHLAFMGALFSTTIEWIQLFVPNRMTDINDVILNTTGAVVGYLLFRFVQGVEQEEDSLRQRRCR